VAYHNERVRQHYGSNRQSYSTAQQQRRDQQQVVGPRAARDQASHLRPGNNVRADGNARVDRRVDGRPIEGRPNVQRESDRVRERLSNNQQANRTRDADTNARTTSGRGNTTLPSRSNDPRPNFNSQNANRDVTREQRAPNLSNNQQVQQATRQAAQQAQRLQQLQRAQQQQRPIENRSTLGNNRQEVRPQTSTQNTNTTRRIERTVQPQTGRPATVDRTRTMRTEGNRPRRSEGNRPSR
jgi:hypothetical protein